jgi:hypothetical protein
MRRITVAALAFAALIVAGTALAATLKTYTVHMKGSVEVPKGAPKGTGTFKYQLDTKHKELCYSLTWSHIDTPLYDHIHKGKAGTAGNVVIVLSAAAPVAHSGCVKTTTTLLNAIKKHPSSYYVNLHTKTYLGGAIRGQLP